MDLEIIKLHHDSNPDEEFIVITSSRTVRVSDYILLLKQTGKLQFTIFPLPNVNLEPNDQLMIYSGEGEETFDKNDRGLIYCSYWNKSESIYKTANFDSICLLNEADCSYYKI